VRVGDLALFLVMSVIRGATWISAPPPALWHAPIFIVFHGLRAHVNSCGNRP
jgi:hypothetical protein